MEKRESTMEQRKLDVDLWIIALTSLVMLGMYMFFQNQIVAVINDSSINLLLRVLLAAIFQFGLAGLGITVVSIFRKEKFSAFGLNKKGIVISCVLSSLCFIPYIVFLLITEQLTGYLPFQSVWMTQEVLSSGFPLNAIGMSMIAIAWGFFEGFNYAVISEKINRRYPSTNRWLNPGAIACAVLCILIHGAIGVTAEGFFEMVAVFFIIYGMLMVKEYTGNAWGSAFVFMFLWNAF